MENLVPQQGSGPSPEEKAQQAQQEETMRRDLMATVLDPAARERCALASNTTSFQAHISRADGECAVRERARWRKGCEQVYDQGVFLRQFHSLTFHPIPRMSAYIPPVCTYPSFMCPDSATCSDAAQFQRKTDFDDDLDF